MSHKIYLGDNNTLDICGKGTIIFNLSNLIFKCIRNELYVPKLAKYLLLINQLVEQGFKMEFETIKCLLKHFDLNKVITEIV